MNTKTYPRVWVKAPGNVYESGGVVAIVCPGPGDSCGHILRDGGLTFSRKMTFALACGEVCHGYVPTESQMDNDELLSRLWIEVPYADVFCANRTESTT